MFCQQCGTRLLVGTKFCDQCGWAIPARLSAVPQPPISFPIVPPFPPPPPPLRRPKPQPSVGQWIGITFVIALVMIGMANWNFRGADGEGTFRLNPDGASSGDVVILLESRKYSGGGKFYNYVTIKNTGTRLVPSISLTSTCTNDAGTVVGQGHGNKASLGPGQQAVVTVIMQSVPGCADIRSRIDSIS
jgi:hypothetical protein